MEIVDELFESFGNQTADLFTFEATHIDGIFKYLKTIDWTERWIIGLMSFHVTTCLVVIMTKRWLRFQSLVFIVLLSLCFFAENLNKLGAENWRQFANEQYFDSNGLFISVLFSMPIILNTSLIVVFWLHENYRLLVEVVQLKAKSKARDQKLKNDKKNE